MKNKLLLSAVASISSFVLVLLSFYCSFGWFAGSTPVDVTNPSSGGQQLNYFASGDGTKDDPYTLTNPKHVYNLSWLQNKGMFTQKTYFRLDANIDMVGALSGTTNTTGAVPPIGTTSQPFIGVFDGQGYTISNLWVSSNPEDWKEQPINTTIDVGTDIGFFGHVGTPDTFANISYLYLENIEVTVGEPTSSTAQSTYNVGLVAGYIDASMSLIGVKNGKISAKQNIGTITSDYTLVGKTPDTIIWGDLPGSNAGGDLKIIPTDYPNLSLGSGSEQTCVNAVLDSLGNPTAKIIGTLQNKACNPSVNTVYVYGGSVTSNLSFGQTYTLNANANWEAGNTTQSAYQLEPEFWQAWNGQHVLSPTGNPDFNVGANELPHNCIWFKPIASGTCSVSFAAEKMNSDGKMSIYRFNRNTNGTIITPTSSDMITFVFSKSTLKNGNVVYFSFPVDSGYEYAIGRTIGDSSTNVNFLFLKLAGTDISGGNEDGSMDGKNLKQIDFLSSNATFDSITYYVDADGNNQMLDAGQNRYKSDYEVHNSLLRINYDGSGLVTTDINYYVNATATNGDKVHYFDDTSTMKFAQVVSTNVEAVQESAYSSTTFPPRVES